MILDWIAFIVILGFVLFLAIRTQRASEKKRPGTFILAAVQSVFFLRLGILRLATNGGTIPIVETNHDLIEFLGSSLAFLIFILAFIGAYLWHATEEAAWVTEYDKKQNAKKERRANHE